MMRSRAFISNNVGVLREVADGAVTVTFGRAPTVGFFGDIVSSAPVASDEADAHAFIDPKDTWLTSLRATDSSREKSWMPTRSKRGRRLGESDPAE